MTAGMNARNLDAGRISLPRAGLGVLLAVTLLAGSLIGAATYAAISRPNASTAATQISVAVGTSSAAVREGQLATGHGPLLGDVAGQPAAAAVRDTLATGVTRTTGFPAARDGFGFGPAFAPAPTVTIQHAAGRGPLR